MTTTSPERDLPVARHTGERVHALIWTRRMKQGDVARVVGVGASTFSKRDLLAVGTLLGHSRPETTQRYVRLPDDALRAAARAAC